MSLQVYVFLGLSMSRICQGSKKMWSSVSRWNFKPFNILGNASRSVGFNYRIRL